MSGRGGRERKDEVSCWRRRNIEKRRKDGRKCNAIRSNRENEEAKEREPADGGQEGGVEEGHTALGKCTDSVNSSSVVLAVAKKYEKEMF